MENERSAVIHLGGEEFELLLTTRATKDISKRYGGIEDLGDKLLNSEDFGVALDEIVWLLTMLANQPILIYNLAHRDAPKDLLTEEAVELLTTPFDLASYKNAITEAMFKGTARNVVSAPPENDEGNAEAG